MNSSVSRFAPDVLRCHSRYAGMYSLNHWIPACAGMTAGWIPAFAGRLRASSAVCSRRRSTTSAACSRRRSTTYIPVGVHPCRRALSPHTGLPVHKMTAGWLPAFAAMMKGRLLAFTQMTKGAAARHLSGMAKELRAGNKLIPTPVVIPAQAGIQEGRPGE